MAGTWKRWKRSSQRETELAAEIENHIRERAAQYEAQGVGEAEALRRARMQFGSVQAAKEEIRAFWPGEMLRGFLRDLRYAVRTLARDRAFTIAVVASLAIGLGTATAMYSVLYGVLLQPLPFPNADRIFRIYESETELDQPQEAMAIYWGSLREFQEKAASVDAITAVLPYMPRLDLGDAWPRRVPGAMIDRNFFQVFPARAVLGRLPDADSWDESDRDTAVLSFEMWQNDYGGDPSVVGKTMRLSGTSRAVDRELKIVGVLPADFEFPTWRMKGVRYLATTTEDWRHPSKEDLRFGWRHQDTFIRAAQGASVTALRDELRTLYRGLQDRDPGMPKRALAVVPMADAYAEKDRTPLLLLFCAALVLALLCCLNVANLMVARAFRTAPETGIRKALGGGRAALLRGTFCQSLVLGIAGTAMAAVVAVAVAYTLRFFLPAQVPYVQRIGFTPEVSGFLAGGTFVAILLASGFLGWHAMRTPALTQLSQGGRHTGGLRNGTRQVLLAAQVCTSLILLCGAFLLLANLSRTVDQDFGFAWKDIAAVNVVFAIEDMSKEDRTVALRNLGQELATSLGDNRWAIADNAPLAMMYSGNIMFRENGTRSKPRNFTHRQVSPEYFGFMGIPIVEGRGFNEGDRAGAPPVAVVSRTFARAMLDTDHPIGMRFRRTSRSEEPWITVVGVVEDVRAHTNFREAVPCFYLSYLQFPASFATILLRSQAPADRVDATVRAAIEGAGLPKPEIHIGRVSDSVWVALEQSRFYSLAFSAFAIVALVLAAIGVYGVLQYHAVVRRREFGVRAAMGATRTNLQLLVMRQATLPLFLGGIAGLGAALWASKYLESLLHTIQRLDPQPYVVAACVLLAAAALAGWLPARQAAGVHPSESLRAE